MGLCGPNDLQGYMTWVFVVQMVFKCGIEISDNNYKRYPICSDLKKDQWSRTWTNVTQRGQYNRVEAQIAQTSPKAPEVTQCILLLQALDIF